MARDESWYVIKSTSGMYYLEKEDSIYWVSDINKASRYSRLLANAVKAELDKSYSKQIPVTIEKLGE